MLSILFCCTADSMHELSQKLECILHHIAQGTVRDIGACNHLFPLKKNDAIRLSTAIVDWDEFKSKLSEINKEIINNKTPRSNPAAHVFISEENESHGKTLFMFPGFGSEYASMFTGLFARFPETVHWKTFIENFLGEVGPKQSQEAWDEWLESRINTQQYGIEERGPLGSVFSIVIFQILQRLGISCDAMIGHSNGENSALIASNILKYKTNDELLLILKSVVTISKKYEHPGRYISVANLKSEVRYELLERFQGDLYLAMDNCPNQQVFYVTNTYKKDFLQALVKERAIAFEIPTDHPYHTPVFGHNAQKINEIYSKFEIGKGCCSVYSCVESGLFPDTKEAKVALAIRQWIAPVLFKDTISRAYEDGCTTFIEMGPNGKLAGFCKDILRGKSVLITTASTGRIDSVHAIHRLCGQLWTSRQKVNIEALLPARNQPTTQRSSNYRTLIFSEYQCMMREFLTVQNRTAEMFFQNQSVAKKIVKIPCKTTLINGHYVKTSNGIRIQTRLSLDAHPLVKDHAMGGVLPVVPFTVTMEIAAEAASILSSLKGNRHIILNARSFGWLDFQQDEIPLQITVLEDSAHKGAKKVKIYRESESSRTPELVFQADVLLNKTSKEEVELFSLNELKNPTVTADYFYKNHLFHSTCFRSIHSIEGWSKKGVESLFIMPDVSQAVANNETPHFVVPGPMLDGAGQLLAYWMLEQDEKSYAIFPFEAEEFAQYHAFPDPGTVLKCIVRISRNAAIITGTFEFFRMDGTLLAHLKNFNLRIFRHSLIAPLLMNRLSRETLKDIDPAFLSEGGFIWNKILGKLTLKQEEYNVWLEKSESEQIKQLITHYHGSGALLAETV